MREVDVSARDEAFMDRALSLALEGWGQVSPNPMVGAVVVRGEDVIAEGYHARYGADHAEVMALEAGGGESAGATLYVSLEPCAHHGKTPPCTEAILRSGVARVVFGCRDPDGRAGGGGDVLRAAGVDVAGGVQRLRAARLNAAFIWGRLDRGPWVSLKLGLSLDGRIAAGQGTRTPITGEEAAAYVHRLRAGHDAIMVGARTAMVDDPLLTVRLARRPRVPPTRVVLDSKLETSTSSRLVNTVDEAPLLVLCGASAPAARRSELERAGVEVVSVAVSEPGGGLDLVQVLRELGARGLGSILVEGGGRLAAAMVAGGLVRRQHLIYAPVVLGPAGVPAMGVEVGTSPGDWSVVLRQGLGRDSLLELEDRRAHEALVEAA